MMTDTKKLSKAEFWREWIRAMVTKRSPKGMKLRKARGILYRRRSGRMCCLGVACLVIEEMTGSAPTDSLGIDSWRLGHGDWADLPEMQAFDESNFETQAITLNDSKPGWPIEYLISQAPKHVRAECRRIVAGGGS